MQTIGFAKLNGQGNDFIIIDSLDKKYDLSEELIASMCHRHSGIGADGLILVRKSESADFFMDYHNHDGSLAEMCGNGIRCMARFLIEKNLWSGKTVKIDTRAGIKSIEIDYNKITGSTGDIKVNMGKPVFEPQKIPVNAEPVSGAGKSTIISNYPLVVKNKEFRINCVSMGNPHCVVFIDKEEDINRFPVHIFGPEIEKNPIFPNKTNVEFIKVIDSTEIFMRVWERGVGETLACGTGACASAVCSIMLDRVVKPEITVNLSGGNLDIYWEGNNSDVFLKGTVEYTFNGEYIL
jgi:diaminopimelate epimerase